jgi:glycine cleavage system aminomethyltransferase T
MGFCGEYEYRILCPREKSGELAPRLLDAGREFGIACADPAVFPLLMLEMRSLSKADIPSAGNPVTLGMHCMVSFRKQDYPGSRVLQLSKRDPVSRTLMLRFEQTGVACAGDRLVIDSVDVGFCANVYFSPTLGQDIGLACVDPAFGWVGVPFTVIGKHGVVDAVGVSAPLFVTKTVSAA